MKKDTNKMWSIVITVSRATGSSVRVNLIEVTRSKQHTKIEWSSYEYLVRE